MRKVTELDLLDLSILSCDDCGAKDTTRTKTGKVRESWRVKGVPKGAVRLTESSENPVPGSGPQRAKVVVVGEAPGETEDEEGVPFIGKSGKMLRNELLPLAKINPDRVRYLNVIRCHPEKNRDPYAGEIKACSKWLFLELQLIKPELILCVGAVATHTLLPGVNLRAGHGQVYEWNGIPTVALYHPAGIGRAVPELVAKRDYKMIPQKVRQFKNPIDHRVDRILVRDQDTLNDLYDRIGDSDMFGFDIETNETEWARTVKKAPDPVSNEVAGMAFAFRDVDSYTGELEGYTTYYLPTCDYPDSLVSLDDLEENSWDDIINEMIYMLWDGHRSRLVIHNAKFEFTSLLKYVPEGMQGSLPNFLCTMLMASNMDQETMGLKQIVKRMYGVTQTPFEDVVDLKKERVGDVPLSHIYPYACDDAYWCLRLGEDWSAVMPESVRGSYDLQAGLMNWIVETEDRGVRVSMETYAEVAGAVGGQLLAVKELLREHIGDKEINTGAKKAEVLFSPPPDGLGIKPPTKQNGQVYKTPKTKQISTQASHLKLVAGEHPAVGLVIEHESLKTIKSTFVDGMSQYLHPDVANTVHASVNQTSVRTGRLSYSWPNLTNIPVRSEVGKQVRTLFGPQHEGWVLWAIDQSQIELRWAAHLSEDEWMIEVLSDPTKSIHSQTCSGIYGITKDDDGWEKKYKTSKNGNFARLYGAREQKLSETLEIGLGEAKDFLKLHRELMPGFDRWTKRAIKEVAMRGYASTSFGFRRPLPQIRSGNSYLRAEGERFAINTKIQGSAAQHMQTGMIEANEFLQGYESYMMWQVHDEIVGTSPAYELDGVVRGVADILENCVEISVPTPVDIEVSAKSWGEVIPYDEWKQNTHEGGDA